MFISQSIPVNPIGHSHVKPLIPSLHTDPCMQGFDSHSFMFIEHSLPKNKLIRICY